MACLSSRETVCTGVCVLCACAVCVPIDPGRNVCHRIYTAHVKYTSVIKKRTVAEVVQLLSCWNRSVV